MPEQKNTFQLIYDVVRRIPKGKVCTYGQVAHILGKPNLARVVGYALHANPDPNTIPCHRIVNRFGEVSEAFVFGGANVQHDLLINENVKFLENGRVDLKTHMWYGED